MTHIKSKWDQPQIQVENLTRGQIVTTICEIADNEWARFRGLIGHAPLKSGEGMLILPCSSVHTHFMGFPIDVLFVHKDHRVVGLCENLKPWRFGPMFQGVRYVIELPADTVAGNRLPDGRPTADTGLRVLDVVLGDSL